ncbi:MAG: hypothetical protein JWM99_2979 [Verrucomicrobiales bacterium]|jgi:hypothetical protein|nr:hypothetical protein [Verrucomicrobiales bacterium]
MRVFPGLHEGGPITAAGLVLVGHRFLIVRISYCIQALRRGLPYSRGETDQELGEHFRTRCFREGEVIVIINAHSTIIGGKPPHKLHWEV